MKKRLRSIFGSNQALNTIDENRKVNSEKITENPAENSKNIPSKPVLVKSLSDKSFLKQDSSSQHADIKRKYKSSTESHDNGADYLEGNDRSDAVFTEESPESKSPTSLKISPHSNLTRASTLSFPTRPWLPGNKRASLARREANTIISNVYITVS